MIIDIVNNFLIELGVTVLVLSALLITCGVLWDVRPLKGPQR